MHLEGHGETDGEGKVAGILMTIGATICVGISILVVGWISGGYTIH